MDRFPGFKVARRIEAPGDTCHNDRAWQQCRDGRHSRLDREQIGVASSVQRQRGHFGAGYHLAEMGRNRIHLHAGRGGDCYRVGLVPNRERDIYANRRVGVHGEIALSLRCESGHGDGEIVVANRKIGERIEAFSIGHCLVFGLLSGIYQLEVCPRHYCSSWIDDSSGDTAAGCCAQGQSGEKAHSHREG